MKSFFQFLIDATLDQAKSTLRAANYNKTNMKSFYQSLFNNPKFKTDSNNP